MGLETDEQSELGYEAMCMRHREVDEMLADKVCLWFASWSASHSRVAMGSIYDTQTGRLAMIGRSHSKRSSFGNPFPL